MDSNNVLLGIQIPYFGVELTQCLKKFFNAKRLHKSKQILLYIAGVILNFIYMSAALVFQIVNTIVLPAWLVLIFFPKNAWRNTAIYAFAMVMSVIYAYYVVSRLGELDMESFSTLEGIKAMFTTDVAVLTGWVHYLVFDLLVGNWVLNNAQKHKINHYLVIPCLLLCFIFGPVGFLLYSIIKLVKVKSLKE